MSNVPQQALMLAAEEYPIEKFSEVHSFLKEEESLFIDFIIGRPTLLSGSRGSGKSALLIEGSRKVADLYRGSGGFGIYISLRDVNPLQSGLADYEKRFCKALIDHVQKSVDHLDIWFYAKPTIEKVRNELGQLRNTLQKELILLFDDVIHVGHDPFLWAFVELMAQLPSYWISCNAAVYPGVTKFGTQFEVYDYGSQKRLPRSWDMRADADIFADIMTKRFGERLPEDAFGQGLNKKLVAGFLGKAVLGNMRAFILTCHHLAMRRQPSSKIELSHLEETLRYLARSYYSPLLDQLRPKLGIYQPLIKPALELSDVIFKTCAQQDSGRYALVHQNYIRQFTKLFELLEHAGLISLRSASQSMTTTGDGVLFGLNLCNLLDATPNQRLTDDLLTRWIEGVSPEVEFHRRSPIGDLNLPEPEDILERAIIQEVMQRPTQSFALSYGFSA